MFDVAIIGAGPAGSAAATLLAQRGHSILLLDKARFPRDKICGECLSPGTLPLLAELGIDTATLQVMGGHPYYGCRLVGPTGNSVALPYPDGAYGMGLQRRPLDFRLFQIACSEKNVEAREEITVLRIEKSGNTFRIYGHDNKNECFQARSILWATGRPSLNHRSHSIQRLCLLGRFSGCFPEKPIMECGIVRKGLQYIIGPQGPQHALLCLVITQPRKNRPHLPKKDFFLSTLNQMPHLHGRILPERLEGSIRGLEINPDPTADLVRDGELLIGDRTGSLDPITGEGIHRALKSAFLASGVLDNALRKNDLSKKSLLPYAHAMSKNLSWTYRFVSITAWITNRPEVMGRIIDRIQLNPKLQTKLAGIQGALIPARQFFSFKTIAQLFIPFGEVSHDAHHYRHGDSSSSSHLHPRANLPPL